MGSLSYYRAPGESDRDHLQRELFHGTPNTIIDSATVRQVFYGAVRNDKTGQVWALVVKQWRTRGDFNYTRKEMDETMGPYAFDCPDRILDLLTPTDHKYATEWRAKCREHNAAKRNRPKVKSGDTVRFPRKLHFGDGVEEDTFILVQRSTLRRASDRRLVRIPAWRNSTYEVIAA